jgi:hypothetical protein
MRLLRHLSFSNVIAMLALFVALGGAAYAGTKINGSSIKNGSIGGGKLKNETITGNKLAKGTITGTQIAPGSISSSSIDLSTLGTVPSAQAANTAGTATKADSANTATSATTATSADSAKSAETAKRAETADEAKHAESADDATHAETADSAAHADVADQVIHAESADTATHADTADNATHADTATVADEATKLGGKTAAELGTELKLSCKTGTKFYGGMCWDEATRPAKLWIFAVKQCGELGGRLPTIEELIAFVLQPDEQVTEQTWSADVDSLDVGKKEIVFTTDENGRSTEDSGLANPLGYRCVFPQSN